MTSTASRMDAIMRKTREGIAQRAMERARLAEKSPPRCVECGEPFPEGHLFRKRALDAMQAGKAPRAVLCSTCLAAAQRQNRTREAAEAEAERAARIKRVREDLPRYLARAGVPPVLLGARFSSCPDLPARLVERVRCWAEAPEGFLMLMGPVGSGKSWLAVSALAHVMGNGGVGRFLTERGWLGDVRNDYGEIVVDRGPMGSAFLAYDDLGASYLNEMRHGVIQDLIRERYDYHRPTIITTNAGLATLDDLVGSRALSVIRAGRNVLQLDRADLRQSGSLPGM